MTVIVDQNEQCPAGPSTYHPGPPTFDFSNPASVAHISAENLDSEVSSNFFRYARWCPDGTSILTTAEDRVIRIFDTPSDTDPYLSSSCRIYTQPDAIHSTVWYPTASAAHPETFVFLVSVRDGPVKMVDALTGITRATYPIIDHRERFVAPHSMAFNPNATKVYCGHVNAIEILDISAPGHNNSERIKTIETKREKGGQKGIISSLAFATDYSGLYAAGSFGGQVSLYQEDVKGAAMHLEGVDKGGVTQVQFHPLSSNHLFVASRRSTHIQVYDLRNPSMPYSHLPRKGTTNQRLMFDLDPWGRYIVAGDEDGSVKGWDISKLPAEEDIQSIMNKKLHHDAVGSVQLHPFRPLLLTASGSRSYLESGYEFDEETDTEDDDDSDANSEVSEEHNLVPVSIADHTTQSGVSRSKSLARPADTALRIWSMTSSNEHDIEI